MNDSAIHALAPAMSDDCNGLEQIEEEKIFSTKCQTSNSKLSLPAQW